jgi:acyl-coenzyme A synthetase/AMP-(fatty) acid ligase
MTAEPTPLAAFRQRAMASPLAIAVIDHDGTPWTRARLLADCDAAVHGLRHRGFKAGDCVLFSVRPGARALALALAVYELGGVLAPQDPGVGDALFLARLTKLNPKWVFAESPLLLRPDSLASRLLGRLGHRFVPLASLPGVQFVRVGRAWPGSVAAIPYEDLARAPLDAASSAMLSDDADALFVHTSGTTSAPRVVVHTRRSLMAVLAAVSRELDLQDGDVLFARDLHLLLPALAAGAKAVVPSPGPFNAARTMRTITHHHVTHAFFVTRDCRLLLEHCEATQQTLPDRLRLLLIGAAPVRSAFLSRLRHVLPPDCKAWCVYGSTEVLPIARVSLEDKVAWLGEGDLVGAAIAGVDVRIRQDGQLAVRGERLCRGYLGEPNWEECATGDIARLDGNRIVLMGRAKDMIIRGEHNIYPELYEPTIEKIPGVRRAALIGDFDAALADERVILVIEPMPNEPEEPLRRRVTAALRNGPHRIDSSALPDCIEIRPLPEGGRSGKVDKHALRLALGARSPVR